VNWINYFELAEITQNKFPLNLFSQNVSDTRFLLLGCEEIRFIFVHYKSVYQIGCWLSEEFRGQGYGSLYFDTAIKFLERDPPEMVIASTEINNIAMQKMLYQQNFKVMSFFEKSIIFRKYFKCNA
jgi:ribosomal protein S18 acetylase RimI-like enzyme